MQKPGLQTIHLVAAAVLLSFPFLAVNAQHMPDGAKSPASSQMENTHMTMGHSAMGMGMKMAPQFPIEKLQPLEAPKGVTALAGQTLQIDGEPLKHVKIEIDGQKTYTDKAGRFLLSNLTFGHHVLNVYGATAKPKRPYGFFQIAVEIEKGMTNVLPFTMFIPVLDMEHATHFALQRDNEVVATTPLIPGFEVHIPPGEVLYGTDGKPLTEVTITPIPMMQMPMPGAIGTNPPISFTLQADGATDERPDGTFGPGVSLVFPNTQHMRPGTRVDYWTYDPKIVGGWFIYGGGRVTPDGKKIVPDPGAVLHRLSCSPLNHGPTPVAQAAGHGGAPSTGGDPVDLSTGLFLYKKTDMVIDDIIPIVFGRSYRQLPDLIQASTGDFGTGAFSSYSSWFWEDTTTDWDIVMPDESRYHYTCISSTCGGALGTVMQNSTDPGPFYMSTMTATTYPTAPYQGVLYFALRLKDGTTYGYNLNSSQELSYIRDRAGNQLNITHTSSGQTQIIQITSPSGRWLRPTYDSSNRIVQIQDNIGRTVSYTYDANNHVHTVTDAAGGVTTYTYDASDNMLTITDARNILYLTNQYDANNRVIKQTQADGSVYQFAYTLDVNGNVTQTAVTDPRGHVRVVTFNNSSSTSSYWTSNTSDSTGSAPETIGANRQPATNLVNSTTDALGRQTTMAYDAMGNVTSITKLAGTPQAVTTSFTYDPTFNQVTSITDPLGHMTSFSYDTIGNLTAVADPLDNQTTFTYNSLGQPLTATDPMGNVTQFFYDSVSNDLASVTDPLNRTTTRVSDDVGRLVAVTDPLGHTTRYQYNPLNLVTQVTDPLGNQTLLGYDGNGNRLNLTDANGHATQYTYDNMDRVATRKDPLLNQESYQYDGNGNLIQFTDRRGKVSVYSYDNLNRLIFAGYGMQPGPTYESAVSYAYDAANRLTEIADSISGTITRDYDGLDRLIAESTPQGTVAYAYDAAGRRASLTVPGQQDANYTFDNANRLTQINQGGSTVAFTYDNAGRRTSMTLPNSITATYNYDDASQLTGLTYASSSTTLGNLSYAYDMAGRRISAGGSYARTSLPLPVSTTAYNANNQLTTWGTANLFYDANGNMTSDGTHSYTWDGRNRLSQIDSGSTASFVYDPLGRRASKTLTSALTSFLYDGPYVVQEVIGTNTANSLIGGVDEVFQRTDSSGPRSSLTDGLGSTLGLADATGTVQTSYTFDPFGNTTASGSPNSNSFAYTGRELDAGNLYYYRARYYNPQLQRFISEDHIDSVAASANLYAYVGNNPINSRDPRGLMRECSSEGCGGLPTSTSTSGRKDPPNWLQCLAVNWVGAAFGVDCVQGSNGPIVSVTQSDGTVFISSAVTGYRAVSMAEYADILNSGEFAPSPFGSEVKYFSNTPEQAQDFGTRSYGEGNFQIIKSEFPASVVTPIHPATEGPGFVVPNSSLPGAEPEIFIPE